MASSGTSGWVFRHVFEGAALSWTQGEFDSLTSSPGALSSGCLELAQEQTSASAALMSQNDPKRSLCSLLSTGATGRWRGLREESRRAIFYSCYRRDSLARSLQYPQSMPIYLLLARRP
jgi:hypothetical protein